MKNVKLYLIHHTDISSSPWQRTQSTVNILDYQQPTSTWQWCARVSNDIHTGLECVTVVSGWTHATETSESVSAPCEGATAAGSVLQLLINICRRWKMSSGPPRGLRAATAEASVTDAADDKATSASVNTSSSGHEHTPPPARRHDTVSNSTTDGLTVGFSTAN